MRLSTGTLFISLSAFFYGSYGVWSKWMSGTFGEFNQAWIRAFLLLVVLVPLGILLREFKPIRQKDVFWFVVISFCGGLNQAPYFYGFEHLSIGTGTLLFYAVLTIGTFFIGKFFFSERLTPLKITSLVLALIGLSIIYRFSIAASQILPAVATCVSGLMGAGVVVFSKKLSSTYSEIQILTAVFISMFFGNFVFGFLMQESIPYFSLTVPWFAQIGYAAAMLLANFAVVAGFKRVEPSIGGLIGLLEVLFAALFGILIFKELITLQLLTGSLFLLLSAGLADLSMFIKMHLLKPDANDEC